MGVRLRLVLGGERGRVRAGKGDLRCWLGADAKGGYGACGSTLHNQRM